MNFTFQYWRCLRRVLALALLGLLAACSPRLLIVQGLAKELAGQASSREDDLQLAREASAFYLKLSESLLREDPANQALAEAVAAGFTQYSYAFVAFEAEKLELHDAKAAHKLRVRAARLYQRAQRHAMTALDAQTPGFSAALAKNNNADWPKLRAEQIGLAYWAAASWGGSISLSKDEPERVADLPLAIRLASLAWQQEPDYGAGALSSLMGSFEAARPGGSSEIAERYFERALAVNQGQNASAMVAKAESLLLPIGDRSGFELLLRQAIKVAAQSEGLSNAIAAERAQWLLERADELF